MPETKKIKSKKMKEDWNPCGILVEHLSSTKGTDYCIVPGKNPSEAILKSKSASKRFPSLTVVVITLNGPGDNLEQGLTIEIDRYKGLLRSKKDLSKIRAQARASINNLRKRLSNLDKLRRVAHQALRKFPTGYLVLLRPTWDQLKDGLSKGARRALVALLAAECQNVAPLSGKSLADVSPPGDLSGTIANSGRKEPSMVILTDECSSSAEVRHLGPKIKVHFAPKLIRQV
jgi:hypothetical protein